MPRHILPLAALLALLTVPAACAPKKAHPQADLSAKGLTQSAASDYYYLLYQEFSRQGQPREALAVVEKLVEIAPTPELYRDLANLHWGLGEADKTREVLEEGMRKYPEEKILFFYMANSYLLQRRFDEATAVLKQYLAKHPKDQSATQELGAVLTEAGKFQQALDLLSTLSKDRRTPAMAYYESKALAGLGRKKASMEKLRQALREDPSLMPAWSELAYHYEQEKDYRQAEEAYRRILDLGDDGPEVWLRLIRLALKQKDEDKALRFLDKAPKDRGFLFQVMGLFADEGYQDGAARVLDRLAKQQPGNADVIFLQAMMAAEKEKDLDKALDLLAKLPKDNKYYEKGLVTRIQLVLDAGALDRAAPLLEEGKTSFPDSIEFHFLDGAYHDKMGDQAGAVEVYRATVEKWPDNTEALYRYGVALERMHNRPEAVKVMESILVKEPDNADALNFVGYSLAEDGRDLDRALDMISRAVATNPESPYFIDSLAWVHFKRGDVRKAWDEIQNAVSKPMGDPAIWEHYGDIAKALGHVKEARKGYEKALGMKATNAQEIQGKLDGLK